MKKFLLLGLFFNVVLFPLQTVFAQLLIEEGKVSFSVAPGGSAQGIINLNNTSDQDVKVRAYWEDFVYLPPFDGKKNFLPAGSMDNSIAKWVHFTPQDFVLPAKSKKKISYSIKVPEDAHGGYYGVLFFENFSEEMKDINGVQIITRVGSLFFLETTDSIKKGRVGRLSAEQNTVVGELENTGDVIITPNGVYYILGKDGVVVDRGEVEKFYIPPREKTKFRAHFSQDLSLGKYTMVITFDLGDGKSVVKEIDFTKSSASETKILEERD